MRSRRISTSRSGRCGNACKSRRPRLTSRRSCRAVAGCWRFIAGSGRRRTSPAASVPAWRPPPPPWPSHPGRPPRPPTPPGQPRATPLGRTAGSVVIPGLRSRGLASGAAAASPARHAPHGPVRRSPARHSSAPHSRIGSSRAAAKASASNPSVPTLARSCVRSRRASSDQSASGRSSTVPSATSRWANWCR